MKHNATIYSVVFSPIVKIDNRKEEVLRFLWKKKSILSVLVGPGYEVLSKLVTK